MARIALVCEGDASRSETAFSGTAKRMYEALVKQGHSVVPVDASLSPLQRIYAAVRTVSTDKQRWRSKFRYGNETSRQRTAAAEGSLKGHEVDVILQIGASFDPPRQSQIPYVIYSDWNMALDQQEAAAGAKSSRGLDAGELNVIGREHERRYWNAAALFTISQRLCQSFIELYGIPQDRVHAVYAGPNFDTELIAKALAEPRQASGFSVLFIAKEFKRKGGDIVATAMAALQKTNPEAKLVFAGAPELPLEFRSLSNVEHLGLLDKTDPQQLQRLLAAYRNADVLVLPSRRDPFPTVIREAMFFGVPCIGSDIWAMPEMIEDGRTGFLISLDNSEALADRLAVLLRDGALREQMGQAAQQRAHEMFSWDAIGREMSSLLQHVVSVG